MSVDREHLLTLLGEHGEDYDKDCEEHFGCSCSPGERGDHVPINEGRSAWREHVADVLVGAKRVAPDTVEVKWPAAKVWVMGGGMWDCWHPCGWGYSGWSEAEVREVLADHAQACAFTHLEELIEKLTAAGDPQGAETRRAFVKARADKAASRD